MNHPRIITSHVLFALSLGAICLTGGCGEGQLDDASNVGDDSGADLARGHWWRHHGSGGSGGTTGSGGSTSGGAGTSSGGSSTSGSAGTSSGGSSTSGSAGTSSGGSSTSGSAGTSSGGSSGAVSCPSSLQSAINNLATGGTLDVTGCSFHERVNINKSMTLNGGSIDGSGLGIPVQNGVLTVSASNVRINGVRAHGSSGAGIRINEVSQVTVADSEFDNNIQEGYSNDGDYVTFLRCHIHHNNVALSVDWQWEAGGGKSHGINTTFDSCESDHNGGPGIWFDTWYPMPYPPDREFNPGAVVKNCKVHDNIADGIQYEVSDGATIVDNVVWSNGDPSWGWYWSAGILIASSRNAEVARNIVAYNLDGISVISQGRDDKPGLTTGVNVHDNVIIQTYDRPGDNTTTKSLLAYVQDWSGHMFDVGTGNVGANNRFWSVYAEPHSNRFAWNGALSTLAQLNATPIGGGSSYLTTAEKDAIVASVGIPAP